MDPFELPANGLDGEPPALDAVVLDADPAGLTAQDANRIVAHARERGAPVIGLAPAAGSAAPVWEGLADVTVGGGPSGAPGPEGVRPVDHRTFNPIGYRHTDVAGVGGAVTAGARDLQPAAALLERVAAEEPVTLFVPRGHRAPLPAGVLSLPLPRAGARRLCSTLKERLGALDHPSFHATEAERAAHLVRLCASGVPVVAEDVSDALARMLGEELAGALAGRGGRGPARPRPARAGVDRPAPRGAQKPLARRPLAPARRRHGALGAGAPEGVGDPLDAAPGVALVRALAGRAPELRAARARRLPPRRRLLRTTSRRSCRAEVEGALTVVHVASELTLGDALNQGVEAATGALVTKMDDDDYYSVDHLWDLVLASEYSGADLVGKAAEFVYLEDIDLTLRRFMGDTEGDAHPRLAGGGMMARREPLREIGGWPSRGRGEDTVLIKTFRQAGRKVHRTHGYGYILNRHGRDHTWNTYVDYFLVQSEREWRGLRFEETGIY